MVLGVCKRFGLAVYGLRVWDCRFFRVTSDLVFRSEGSRPVR